jgi:hypothetical protein
MRDTLCDSGDSIHSGGIHLPHAVPVNCRSNVKSKANEFVPIVLKIVDDGNIDGITPIGFNCGTGVCAIEDQHLTRNPVWRQSRIIDREDILLCEIP